MVRRLAPHPVRREPSAATTRQQWSGTRPPIAQPRPHSRLIHRTRGRGPHLLCSTTRGDTDAAHWRHDQLTGQSPAFAPVGLTTRPWRGFPHSPVGRGREQYAPVPFRVDHTNARPRVTASDRQGATPRAPSRPAGATSRDPGPDLARGATTRTERRACEQSLASPHTPPPVGTPVPHPPVPTDEVIPPSGKRRPVQETSSNPLRPLSSLE
ncbi:hypothetical protein FRC08_004774 [Ceratobasidium sp. 394]|nr:hypothetical protein FRC08_004774 [Ceratobasidium sp. 394]